MRIDFTYEFKTASRWQKVTVNNHIEIRMDSMHIETQASSCCSETQNSSVAVWNFCLQNEAQTGNMVSKM